jgi:hypothetical protein
MILAEIVPCQVLSHMLVEFGFTKSLNPLMFLKPLMLGLKPVSMTQTFTNLYLPLVEAGASMAVFSSSILSNHSSEDTFLSLANISLFAYFTIL